MPIYLLGSLQYFADVRAANMSIDERLAIFHRKFDRSINEQIADAASEPPSDADSAPGSVRSPTDSGVRSLCLRIGGNA